MAAKVFYLPKKRTRRFAISAVITLIALLAGHVMADQTAISFDPNPFYSLGTGQGVYGWQFTADSDLQVSSLGIFDNRSVFDGGFPGDGLLDAHAVAIWDVANPSDPLVTATIPAGTAAPLVDGFRYVPVDSVMLPAGHDFLIAALYASADMNNQDWTVGAANNPGFVWAAGDGIQFGGYRSIISTTLVFPTFYSPGDVYAFGPNFTYSSVPEPSSLSICGLVVVMASRRARARTRLINAHAG